MGCADEPRVVGAVIAYERRRPETSTLYQVVRDNIETLYAAVDDRALERALSTVNSEFSRPMGSELTPRGDVQALLSAITSPRLVCRLEAQ